jgi:hypothetical protein
MRPDRQPLTQSTLELIAKRLTGELKRKRGRRQMTPDHRRALYPVHDAADLVPQVEFILGNAYPNHPGKQIRDRALYVIEQHTEGKVTVRMLEHYLDRAKGNRRRAGP